jgi:hypothetical protein
MSAQSFQKGSLHSYILVIGIVVAVALISVPLLKPDWFQGIFKSATSGNPTKVIGTVGKEEIFQQDLDTELKAAPPVGSQEDRMSKAKQKLANDSIILQAAAQDKIITLDNNIFNSSSKNYTQRLTIINQVKKHFSDSGNHTQGQVISIWFYNNTAPKIAVTQAKQIANSKITSLHQQVASGKMTMEDAARSIQSDSSLAQLDPSYKTNAIFTFDVSNGSKITFDPTFNAEISKLNEGQVSEVYLAQDAPADLNPKPGDSANLKKVDAVYMFAKVIKKQSTSQVKFEDWLNQKKGSYAVSI